jgi:hypothetical protein
MRFPRMTTRRWMVLVAIVGVVLTGLRLWQLRREYLLLSRLCEAKEEASRAHAEWGQMAARRLARGARAGDQLQATLRSQDIEQRRAEFFADLKVKYTRAAERPWIPVPPDPPEPK